MPKTLENALQFSKIFRVIEHSKGGHTYES